MHGGPDIQGARFAAMRWVEEYGIDQPGLIDLEAIAFDRSIIVRKGKIEGAEAWLLRKGNTGIIRVSTNIRETGRERFAVAHELGHWERHTSASTAWLCTTDDIHAYRGSDVELEANAFAAELLMPSHLLKPYLAEEVCIDLVRRVSIDFQTTLTASAVRIVDESPQDCYVVFSQKGCVTWWHRKEHGSGFWIQSKQAISPDTKACGCVTEPSDSEPMEIVLSQAWFPSDPGAEDCQVWEQSVLLGEYDVVLTLLCVV